MNSVNSPRRGGVITLFGNLWIKAFWQLPKAYRSLIRPSSVLSTKASTVCINVEYFLAFLLRIKLRRIIVHSPKGDGRNLAFSIVGYRLQATGNSFLAITVTCPLSPVSYVYPYSHFKVQIVFGRSWTTHICYLVFLPDRPSRSFNS